jgi:hypothetical protein
VSKAVGAPGRDPAFAYAAVIDRPDGEPGMPVDVVARYVNEADGAVEGMAVAFALVRDDGLVAPLGTVDGVGLAPGEAVTTRGNFVIPRETPPGRYRLRATADPENRIPEYSETNNSGLSEAVFEVLGITR